MTDEELIKALRDADAYNRKHYVRDPLHTDAAARIEELVKEAAETHKKTMSRIKKWGGALKGQREAEAKLDKAVAAIRVMMDEAEYPDEVWKIGSAILAELEKTE